MTLTVICVIYAIQMSEYGQVGVLGRSGGCSCFPGDVDMSGGEVVGEQVT